jgi:hypothetical protein
MWNGFKASVVYFAVVFAAGFVFGTLRVLVLVPLVGERIAVLIELPFMLTVSWLACRSIVTRFSVPTMIGPRLVMGGTAFALLMAAEIGLSVFAFSRTVAQHLESQMTTAALLGLAGQVGFALFPFAQMITHRPSSRPLSATSHRS